jgi:hypothetical protein
VTTPCDASAPFEPSRLASNFRPKYAAVIEIELIATPRNAAMLRIFHMEISWLMDRIGFYRSFSLP